MVLRQVLDEIYATKGNEMTIKTMTLEKAINEVLKVGPTIESIVELCEMAVQTERNHIATVFEDNHDVVKHRNNYWLHAANYVRQRGQA